MNRYDLAVLRRGAGAIEGLTAWRGTGTGISC